MHHLTIPTRIRSTSARVARQWQEPLGLFFADQDDTTGTHWFAIVNSIIISGLLTAVVAVIFARTIREDLKAASVEDGKLKIQARQDDWLARSPRKPDEKNWRSTRPRRCRQRHLIG